MEEAAVHRLASSITQLTLCQVSTEEIDAATKLVEKSSVVFRMSRPSVSLIWKMPHANYAN